jgi:hypothetical protein
METIDSVSNRGSYKLFLQTDFGLWVGLQFGQAQKTAGKDAKVWTCKPFCFDCEYIYLLSVSLHPDIRT